MADDAPDSKEAMTASSTRYRVLGMPGEMVVFEGYGSDDASTSLRPCSEQFDRAMGYLRALKIWVRDGRSADLPDTLEHMELTPLRSASSFRLVVDESYVAGFSVEQEGRRP